jgi:hypothetical protein
VPRHLGVVAVEDLLEALAVSILTAQDFALEQTLLVLTRTHHRGRHEDPQHLLLARSCLVLEEPAKQGDVGEEGHFRDRF